MMIKQRSASLGLCLSTSVFLGLLVLLIEPQSVQAQWATNGNNINNTNSGNVGIGTASPDTRLSVVGAGTTLPTTYNAGDVATFVTPTDGFTNIALVKGGIANPQGLHFGVNQAGLYSEIQAAQDGVTTNRLVLNRQGGNVGIGTSTPGSLLHLNSGTTPANTQFRITANGLGSLALLTYAADNIQLGFDQDWSGSAMIARNASSARIIKNAGKLTFSGNTGLTVGSGFTPTDRLSIDLANGNVGIGTSAPSSKLHIVTGTDTYTNLLNLDTGVHLGTLFGVGGTVNNESVFGVSVYRAGQYFTRMFVDQYGRVSLQPNGDAHVGIGTSAPNYRLDVQGGAVNASGGLCIAGDCKTAWSQVGGGSSQWTTAGSTIHYNGGNVGVGTASPVFDVNAAKYLTVDAGPGAIGSIGAAAGTGNAGTAVGQVAFVNSSLGTAEKRLATIVGSTDTAVNSGTLDFWTASAGAFSAPRIRITSSGNVGVGTTTPAVKLHVAGSTRVDGTNGRVYLGTTAATNARGFEIIEENATTFSLRHHDPNVAWRNIVINPYGGNVGIGTVSPNAAYKLDINGNTNVTGDINVTGNINAKYQDVAEWVPATHALSPGTVVTLDPTKSNHVEASSQAYDTRVAGVISVQPGIALGESGENKVLVATTGRVRIKVDATSRPIQIGDLLVTSENEGVAMKSVPVNIGGVQIHRPGTLIGKALEPLPKGAGEILVLLSLQ